MASHAGVMKATRPTPRQDVVNFVKSQLGDLAELMEFSAERIRMTRVIYGCGWLLICLVLVIATSFADREVLGQQPLTSATADTILQSLQTAHSNSGEVFVAQNDLDPLIRAGGGGACASAAAIDWLQTMRSMAGEGPLENPHRAVIASFKNQPDLLNGRVSNSQMAKLIAFYAAEHLPNYPIELKVVSDPRSAYSMDGVAWGESGPDLSTGPGQLKIVSYTFLAADGTSPGRHFALLRTSDSEGEIRVLDPNAPLKERRFSVVREAETDETPSRFVLVPPLAAPPSKFLYVLNTVFETNLVSTDAASSDAEPTLASVKKGIDEIALRFEGTNAYLSPRAWRDAGASIGLPGLDLPKELGGADWPAPKMVEAFHYAGRHNLNLRDVVGGAHVRALLKSSEPEVLAVVRQVAEGDGYMAIAITEEKYGTDMPSMESVWRKVERGYELTGEKLHNARLRQATHVIIFARRDGGRRGDLTAFLVPMPTEGLEVVDLEAHGLTGNSYGGLRFKKLFVPDSRRIGDEGKGMAIFGEHFLYWRLMQTAAALGTAERALEMMKERIIEREAFGGPIGRFTHLQQQLGQYTTEIEMAKALARDVAEQIERGEYTDAHAMISGLLLLA